ncbi:helix-turn-helix domain-containing protein [Nocardiopsis exhalans]|uniref:Helix-turn-helix domain-containing protein n=1 Tax=Nocardiopsis exhalans TaxID=163604 RepID=A0ABY5D126_9ACTN|nr:helix-turn-helix domain-containing protein [Nocardiopsis exhalans]USY17110.1 helix-turn-helix domain-containing protein [Nocardiopsis exhalans]
MESTLTHPSSTSETPNPIGFSPSRKRPPGAFKGIGFILAIWVQQIFSKGLLPSLRSLAALMAIANAVDADGRWCFFFLENLAQRCGKLSVSSLKRGIEDLVEAGIVRKLTRSETIDFFAEDIKRGRSVYQLPCVLELLIPAEDYPELVLADINACRAKLGEEPLNAHNRPSLKRTGTPAQIGRAPSSDWSTDSSPGDCSDTEADGSVRGTSSTGEQTRQKPRGGLFGIIDRIPNIFLANPVADRERLALAVEKLLRQGLGEAEVRALLWGMERLRRPFPALMRRLCDMSAAHRYLSGALGRGVHGPSLPTPSWPVLGQSAPDTQPEQFPVDHQGKATGTCPEHKSTRNVPGGTCSICGRLCRSEPGQLLPEAVAELNASPPGVLLPKPPEPAPPEDAALDPQTLGRMAVSLNGTGSTPAEEPVLKGGLWLRAGSELAPNAQVLAAWARERIKQAPKPTAPDAPAGEPVIHSPARPPWRHGRVLVSS